MWTGTELVGSPLTEFINNKGQNKILTSGNDKSKLVSKGQAGLTESVGSEETLFITLADQLSDAVISTDSNFIIESWNQSATRLFGFESSEMLGRSFIDILSQDYIREYWDIVTEQLNQSSGWQGKFTTITGNGLTFSAEGSVTAVKSRGYIFVCRPASLLQNANAILRAQVLTQSFVNALAEGLVVQNRLGEVLLANKMAEIITGLTVQQMVDKHYLETEWKSYTEEGNPFTWDMFPSNAVLNTGLPQKNVVLGVRKANDQTTWMNINSLPVIHEKTKELLGTVTSFTDITEIRTSQQAIIDSEEKWRSVLNNNKNGIFLIGKDYRIQLVNEDARKRQRLMPHPIDIKEGMLFLDILPEARKAPVKEALDRVLRGEEIEYEVVYTKANNEDVWLLASYAPVRSKDGEIASICFTVNDVTSIKNHEAALSKSEQRWKFALDGVGDGVWEYNFQTRESYYSPLYKTMLGFAENEFKNESFEWHSRIHPEDVDKVTRIDLLYEQGKIENHSVEYRLKNKAGQYIWVLDRGMVLDRTIDGKPLILIGTHKDITEQRNREESLLQSKKLFSSFMDNTPTMTWIIDEHNIFRYLNAPYIKAFNLSTEYVGRSLYEVFPKHIADVFVENNWKAWNKGSAIETIEDGIGPDGSAQLYQIFKFPLEPENGVKLLGGVALDITQKAFLEKQLTEEQEKKKLEIIQAIINAQENERKELAYELHDNVNQILSSSRLMLEVAAEKPEKSHEFVTRSLSYLHDAIAELRKISHSLIPATLRDISLDAAIEEVIENINSSKKINFKYDKEINIASQAILPEIQLSVLRIAQEQFNNIFKHSGATETWVYLYISEEMVSLTVRDNGVGFDPSITKKGLGLNNIYNRVEFYHGSVTIDSTPGTGCNLHVEFPITQP